MWSHLSEAPRVGEFIGTERRRGRRGRKNGEQFSGDRVLVLQDGESLRSWCDATELCVKMVKVINCVLCKCDHSQI